MLEKELTNTWEDLGKDVRIRVAPIQHSIIFTFMLQPSLIYFLAFMKFTFGQIGTRFVDYVVGELAVDVNRITRAVATTDSPLR